MPYTPMSAGSWRAQPRNIALPPPAYGKQNSRTLAEPAAPDIGCSHRDADFGISGNSPFTVTLEGPAAQFSISRASAQHPWASNPGPRLLPGIRKLAHQ